MGCRAGELRRHRLLGRTSLYRVLRVEGEHVHVEVVLAPGLRVGSCYRFTQASVELMENVTEAATDDAQMTTLAEYGEGPSRQSA